MLGEHLPREGRADNASDNRTFVKPNTHLKGWLIGAQRVDLAANLTHG
jgi:hypothetical protein